MQACISHKLHPSLLQGVHKACGSQVIDQQEVVCPQNLGFGVSRKQQARKDLPYTQLGDLPKKGIIFRKELLHIADAVRIVQAHRMEYRHPPVLLHAHSHSNFS